MAGSIVATATDLRGGVTKYSIVWTSDASGVVSANTFDVRRGALIQTKFVPSSGSAPTDLYDVVINDADGVDILQGNGANLSATVGSYVVPSSSGLIIEAQTLTVGVTNAGNAKSGTIVLYIWP